MPDLFTGRTSLGASQAKIMGSCMIKKTTAHKDSTTPRRSSKKTKTRLQKKAKRRNSEDPQAPSHISRTSDSAIQEVEPAAPLTPLHLIAQNLRQEIVQLQEVTMTMVHHVFLSHVPTTQDRTTLEVANRIHQRGRGYDRLEVLRNRAPVRSA